MDEYTKYYTIEEARVLLEFETKQMVSNRIQTGKLESVGYGKVSKDSVHKLMDKLGIPRMKEPQVAVDPAQASRRDALTYEIVKRHADNFNEQEWKGIFAPEEIEATIKSFHIRQCEDGSYDVTFNVGTTSPITQLIHSFFANFDVANEKAVDRMELGLTR